MSQNIIQNLYLRKQINKFDKKYKGKSQNLKHKQRNVEETPKNGRRKIKKTCDANCRNVDKSTNAIQRS